MRGLVVFWLTVVRIGVIRANSMRRYTGYMMGAVKSGDFRFRNAYTASRW